MDFQIGNVEIVDGVITYEDGTTEPISLAALINVIIDFINALLRNEKF